MRLETLRKDVVRTTVDLYTNGMVRNNGAGGNVSARDPESGIIAVTPSQIRYDTMKAEDIVLIDLDGNVIEGKPDRKPTSESPMHRMILREFADVNAVVHTHSPYAIAMSLLFEFIPAIHTSMPVSCGGPIPVSHYVTPGTDEMGRVVIEKLKTCPAMIIRNHGPVVVGKNLAAALQRSFVVEDCSKTFYLARSIGEPRIIPEADVKRLRARGVA